MNREVIWDRMSFINPLVRLLYIKMFTAANCIVMMCWLIITMRNTSCSCEFVGLFFIIHRIKSVYSSRLQLFLYSYFIYTFVDKHLLIWKVFQSLVSHLWAFPVSLNSNNLPFLFIKFLRFMLLQYLWSVAVTVMIGTKLGQLF